MTSTPNTVSSCTTLRASCTRDLASNLATRTSLRHHHFYHIRMTSRTLLALHLTATACCRSNGALNTSPPRANLLAAYHRGAGAPSDTIHGGDRGQLSLAPATCHHWDCRFLLWGTRGTFAAACATMRQRLRTFLSHLVCTRPPATSGHFTTFLLRV